MKLLYPRHLHKVMIFLWFCINKDSPTRAGAGVKKAGGQAEKLPLLTFALGASGPSRLGREVDFALGK